MQNEVDRSEHHKSLYARAGLTAVKKLRSPQAAFSIGALICALFSCLHVQAESLDGMKVLSALNEPLHAQLVLNGHRMLRQGCAKADIESLEGEFLNAADIRIVTDGETQTMMLATRNAIHEPAVNVVVQMNCDSQETHAYPVLLDIARTEGAVDTVRVPAVSKAMKAVSAIGTQQSGAIPSDGQVIEGTKLQLSRSLSGLNFLVAGTSVAADTVVNGEDNSKRVPEERNSELMSADTLDEQSTVGMGASGVRNWMHEYRQPILGICAALTCILILSLWRNAHRASTYPTRKVVKRTSPRRSKTVMKTWASPAALDPIPYTKPDMTLIAAANTMHPYTPVGREHQLTNSVHVAISAAQADNQIAEDPSARPPLYNVEEIADETQLAKLCIGLNQPLQAIEILEVYWGQKQPNTPLPWQCLLELYRTTGDLNKYRELIGRFNEAFGDNAAKRAERTERVEEVRRMRA